LTINNISHVCVIVSNMNQSISFYRDILGLTLKVDRPVKSPGFCKGVGLKDVEARVAMFALEGENTLIELFEYSRPEGENIGAKPPNTVPTSHIAFNVTDIEAHYSKLKSKGVKFISEPQKLGDDVIFCYFRGPDGELFELIEFPGA